MGIVVVLLFATRLKQSDMRRVINLYLIAISLCAVYTLAQAIKLDLLDIVAWIRCEHRVDKR